MIVSSSKIPARPRQKSHAYISEKDGRYTLIVGKRKFTPAILFCLDKALFIPKGVNNAQFLRDSEPIRLLVTPIYILRNYNYIDQIKGTHGNRVISNGNWTEWSTTQGVNG